MADFATVEDIEAFLQVDITTAKQIASAQRALTEATHAIKNYTKQHLEAVADEEVTFDVPAGTRMLFLPELPVTALTEVVEDGETLTVDDDYKLGNYGILHRIDQDWEEGIQIVTVTYSHGYSEIPQDIVDVATRAAARAYQLGLRSAEDGGVPGVASKSLGDFSVAYSSAGDFSVGEGVMGASAARFLLMSEKDILDDYRIDGP